MMGQTANQDQLFYAFNLEDHIPRGHLLRGVNRFLDLSVDARPKFPSLTE
jgi:transposase